MSKPQPSVFVFLGLIVTLYGLVPVVVLAGLYGGSQLVDLEFGLVMFGLTMVVFLLWAGKVGGHQSAGGQLEQHSMIEQALADRGMTGKGQEERDEDGEIDYDGILYRYNSAEILSPMYLTIVLTIAVVLGWALLQTGTL